MIACYNAQYLSFFYSEINVTPMQQEAFNYYKKNSMSIELVKDDHLQKVNFRVKNKVHNRMTYNYVVSMTL